MNILDYATGPLAVLALHQPYATLCVAPNPAHDGRPAKTHETRHWYPNRKSNAYPLRVAIHAAKKFDKENRSLFTSPPFAAALRLSGFYPGDSRPFLERKIAPPGGLSPIALGAIVGLATITTIVSAQQLTMNEMADGVLGIALADLTSDDAAFGYWIATDDDPNRSRYGWTLENTVLLPEPVPHTGRQDVLYPLALHEREAINGQLRAMAGA